jgi:hypothetical protein
MVIECRYHPKAGGTLVTTPTTSGKHSFVTFYCADPKCHAPLFGVVTNVVVETALYPSGRLREEGPVNA